MPSHRLGRALRVLPRRRVFRLPYRAHNPGLMSGRSTIGHKRFLLSFVLHEDYPILTNSRTRLPEIDIYDKNDLSTARTQKGRSAIENMRGRTSGASGIETL